MRKLPLLVLSLRFFQKDDAGKVIALVDRRDNNDLVWRRD